MGKSNKFDFTNRASSGIKLGGIIRNALQKEAEKSTKGLDKQHVKGRRLTGASSSGAPDLLPTAHTLELKVPGRHLGDDGACEVVKGLRIALSTAEVSASLVLEELNLSGNGITTITLRRLSSIVKLAKHSLKSLDLSQNSITVRTSEQVEHWETFLQSFQNCTKLSTVDLSGNHNLGPLALEIFAHVHLREGETAYDQTMSAGVAEVERQYQAPSTSRAHDFGIGSSLNRENSAFSSDVPTGLHGVSTIVLEDVGLTDAGALWLSFVLQGRRHPVQEIHDVKSDGGSISPDQIDAKDHGIEFDHNGTLGRDGIRLLQKIESFRVHTLRAEAQLEYENVEEDRTVETTSPDRRSLSHRSRGSISGRRHSVRSGSTSNGGEHEMDEVESTRKKIQRQIILQQTATSVRLWRIALRILAMSRLILVASSTSRHAGSRNPLHNIYIEESAADIGLGSPSSSPIPQQGTTRRRSSNLYRLKENEPTKSDSSVEASIALGTGSQTSKTLETFNVHDTQRARSLDLAFSISEIPDTWEVGEGPNRSELTDKFSTLSVDDGTSNRFASYQIERISRLRACGRVDTAAGQLPRDVLDHLLSYMTSPREIDVLSAVQRHTVWTWGLNRETLTQERAWMRKDESVQVLMLLDAMKCLEYGV